MSPHLHLKCLDSLTVSGLAPEIAMWRLYTDDKAGEEDWYIKPNVYGVHLVLVTIPADRQEQHLDRWT